MTDGELLERCREAIRLHDTWDHPNKISAEDAAYQIKAAVDQYDQDFANALHNDLHRPRSQNR